MHKSMHALQVNVVYSFTFSPSTSIGSSPVSELELNTTSDTTLLISWGEPVSPNGNILNYSITVTDLRDDSIVRSENRGAEETTSFVETNLGDYCMTMTSIIVFMSSEPGVPYYVNVSAVNRAGMGEDTGVTLFTRELSTQSNP